MVVSSTLRTEDEWRICILANSIYHWSDARSCASYVAVALAALFAWHLYYARKSRKRAFEVLGWIEDLICGHGHVAGIKWQRASTIHVPVKLRFNAFHNASLNVNLVPRELPHKWVLAKIKKLQE